MNIVYYKVYTRMIKYNNNIMYTNCIMYNNKLHLNIIVLMYLLENIIFVKSATYISEI